MLRAALGFRAHSGWAAMVILECSSEPEVIERRRVELVDRRIRGSEQPYHAATEMKLADAEKFLERCATTALAMATQSVKGALSELTSRGYEVAGSCVLQGSGRPVSDLAATLRSHPMIHTAEGQFFREALQKACESCGLAHLAVKEKELMDRAADTIRISPVELQRRIAALGKTVGPPWRQDEKLCTMAAWLVLASR